MKTSITLLAILLAGCQGNTRLHETQGATPGVQTPVGPVPGPGVAAHSNPNPYSSSDPIAVVEGRKWFVRYNCSGCHGGYAGGGMGPSLRDVDWRYGNTDPQIYDSIAEGRSFGMPAWGTKIPEAHIWKIVAYIKSMRTENEPRKPSLAEKAKAPPAAVLPGRGDVDLSPGKDPQDFGVEAVQPAQGETIYGPNADIEITKGGHEHVEKTE